ncbi:Scr1 family TA system antitoxin-like transcriptional regulator [Streptomyces bacillaris]|uniref:Scr1 family TA system antitoxin-like transcriptional regulator n=1 Tax=Streptomyces bacillaris TaxID=68179 RepID=UPI000515E389
MASPDYLLADPRGATPEEQPGSILVRTYLRHLREAAGLGLQPIARRAGLTSTSTVSGVERGRAYSRAMAEKFIPVYPGSDFTTQQGLFRLARGGGAHPRSVADSYPGSEQRLAALEERAVCARIFSRREIPFAYQTSLYRAWRSRVTGRWHCPRPLAPARPQADGGGAPLVLLEARVLQRPLGGFGLFADQLSYLLREIGQDRLRLRIVPPPSPYEGRTYDVVTELVMWEPKRTRVFVREGLQLTYTSGSEGVAQEGAFLNRATATAMSQTASVRLLEQAQRRYAARARSAGPGTRPGRAP